MSRATEIAPIRAGIVGAKIAEIKQFYRDVKLEMKRVTWPSRRDVINTTVITIVAVFFFSFYLMVVDLGLTKGIEELTKLLGK